MFCVFQPLSDDLVALCSITVAFLLSHETKQEDLE